MDREEMIELATKRLLDRFRSDAQDGSMTAALAGEMLGDVGYALLPEFTKFKYLLAELEKRGTIRTGINSKGAFALWLQNKAAPERNTSVLAPQSSNPHRPLRQDVWRAFVSFHPSGHRFFNKITGTTLVGQAQAPSDAGVWVEIKPMDPEMDRQDARTFLSNEKIQIEGAVETALAAPAWFVELPRVLSPAVAAAWKRRRTGRVVDLVEEWRHRHGVSDNLIYAPAFPPKAVASLKGAKETLRGHLLGALGRMTDDELLNLQLPARCLFEQLRPDLLQH